jgi:4-hydroxybenzoate polyprenyltransferase
VALAGMGERGWLLIAWLALGAWAMRSAGCVYNDIVDRDLDRQVERTRLRPLASGRVSLKGAWILLVAMSLIGLVFSWAALVGWPAVDGRMAAAAFWLWGGSIFWVIGYDTIYALQDKEDDALVGVKSSALALGKHARLGILICYLVALLFWTLAIREVRLETWAPLALLPMALHLLGQVAMLNPEDGADALAKFRSNRLAGLLMFAACYVVGTA